MKYKAIIFDVSDTLIEYSPNYEQIYGDRLQSLNLIVSEKKAKEISRAVNWAIGEQNRKEQAGEPHASEDKLNLLLDEAALICLLGKDIYIENYLTELLNIPIPKQKMSVIAGVTQVLGVLKCKYRLAIVSNHYAWLMDFLQECDLSRFFECIVISDLVGVAKPNIRIMETALEQLGLNAENCLYVGDQPMDVLCSKQAGMDCVWIEKDGSQLPETIPYTEDFRITHLSDLLAIL